jgi:hypothetical protein
LYRSRFGISRGRLRHLALADECAAPDRPRSLRQRLPPFLQTHWPNFFETATVWPSASPFLRLLC